jgi:gluconolactonase
MLLILFIFFVNTVVGIPATGVFIPSSYTYLLPEPFDGPISVLGNFSTNYLSTTSNKTVNDLFARAKKSTYYAFDQEFYEILGGHSPDISLIGSSSKDLFNEGGTWLPDRNEVWFTSLLPSVITVLNLKTNKYKTLDIPALEVANPLGLEYHAGTIYVACAGNIGNHTVAGGVPGIFAINPATLETTKLINSFFGLKFLMADDLTVVGPDTSKGATSCTHRGETNIFFTSFSLASQGYPFGKQEMLPDAVWRFSPQTQSLQGAISRADILSPNGIRIHPNGRYLYVTDTDATTNTGNVHTGGGAQSSGSSAIYRFELDEDCMPFNKKLIALVRSYADGLRIDDHGRIWTGEYDGVVVRSPRGKVLGVFNADALQDGTTPPLTNFALAGDKLIIQAVNKLYVVKLGQVLSTAKDIL